MQFLMSYQEIFYSIMEVAIKIYKRMNLIRKFTILELLFKTLLMNQLVKTGLNLKFPNQMSYTSTSINVL